MVEANLCIIQELKCFLETVCQNDDIRNLFTYGQSDFSRERKLPMERLVGMIINLPKRSLSVELQDFFASLADSEPPCTKSAFCQRRGKLNPVFFQVWNQFLVECFYKYYHDHIKRWRGFRLLAVDGSTGYLIDKPEVIAHFGTQGNHHSQVPMARIMQIMNVLNDITVWGEILPTKYGERKIISHHIDRLYPDSITLFDRGFASYSLMYLMINLESPRKFVIRCKADFNNEVKSFMESEETSRATKLTPNHKSKKALWELGFGIFKNTTIKVRMVKVQLGTGETEVLLTNLYDEEMYTLKDLKELYAMRWGIETSYGKQKNQMQMEQFSGHRVICIQQDYFASLFVANLQSLIEKQSEPYLKAVNRKRKHNYKINRNVSWGALKNNIVKLFLEKDPKAILEDLQQQFERNLEPIRPGRSSPRTKRKRKLKGKYHTLTNYKRAI